MKKMQPPPLAIPRPFRRKSLALLLACGSVFLAVPATAAEPTQADVQLDAGGGRQEADRLAAEAVSLMENGRLDEASEKINQALRMQIPRSYYHLVNGLIYHLQAHKGGKGSLELAAQGYDMAMQFDRSNWLAYYFAGLLALEQQQFTKGRNLLAEALQYRKDDRNLLNAFSYAAYRAGSPDMAAAAVTALEGSGGLRDGAELRNAAMVMAAVGEDEKAKAYLGRLAAEGDKRADYLSRRASDWNDYYKRPGFVKTADGWGDAPAAAPAAPAASGGWGDAPATPAAPAAAAGGWGDTPAAPATGSGISVVQVPGKEASTISPDEKMVVVDLVMIGTEENLATSSGVNLLSGLSLQFGGGSVGGGAAFQSTASRAADGTVATTLTRALTIPAITYTLNIVNMSSQRSEILTRPTLVATAGKASEFFAGTELNAAALGGGTGSGGTAVASAPISIQKEIGVKLNITPTFLPDGRLKLQVSALRTFIKTPSPDVSFQFKIETTKVNVNANVVMRYGETLVLGGLSEKETEQTRDGVPGLQDVPLVQYLFSTKKKSDYQNSMLILVTPRLPQYVYQPEKAREEYEKSLSEEERPLASLRTRYADWFKPYPNWASVFNRLQDNALYREFRTGDVTLESWSSGATLKERLREIKDFLYY